MILETTYLENRSMFQELRTVIRENAVAWGNGSYLLCHYESCYLLEIEAFVLVSTNLLQCLV